MAGTQTIGRLKIGLLLDKASFDAGLSGASGQIDKFTTSISRKMVGLGARVSGVLAGALTIRGAAGMADEWSDLQSQVGTTIGSMEKAPDVMRRLSDMARQSYSSISQTTGAFTANSTALKDLGYNTDDQLKYTEALNNALVITATRGDKAASVQNALSKAMATGKLAGDGLDAVLANGGRVAQALADKLGVPVSSLRKLGAEGNITAAVISGAMIDSLEKLRDEAGAMPATIADGFTLLRNASLEFVGVLDGIAGASGGVATALVAVSDGIRSVTAFLSDHAAEVTTVLNTLMGTGAVVAAYFATQFAVGFVQGAAVAMAAAARQAIALELALGATSRSAAVAGVATKALAGAMGILKGAIISTGIGVLVVGAGYLVGKFMQLVTTTGSLGNAFSLLGEVASGVWSGIVEAAGAVPLGLKAKWASVKADFYDLIASMLTKWKGFLSSLSGGLDGTIFQGASDRLKASADGMAATIAEYNQAASVASIASDQLAKAAGDKVSAGLDKAKDALSRLNVAVDDANEGLAGDGGLGGAGGGLDQVSKGSDKAKAKLSDLQQVMKRLKEQNAELKATMNMSDVDADVWRNQRDAGVSADSNDGKQIATITKMNAGMQSLRDATKEWQQSISSAFSSFLTGASSFKDMIAQIIGKLGEMALNSAFQSMFSSSSGWMGSILSGLGIGANANGTNNWRGGLTRINERGSEIVDLPSGTRIIPHDVSKRMMDGAGDAYGVQLGASSMTLTDDGRIMAQVDAKVVRMGKAVSKAIPSQIKAYNKDPRKR